MLPGRIYTFDDIAAMIRRRAWVIAIPMFVAGVVTAAVLARLPDRFRADTLILVIPQRVPESYVKATVTTRIEDRLQSISQQLLSRTRLERTILDFDLYRRERQSTAMEDVVERMRANIQVQIVKGDAFRVSYIADTPALAQKVTERLSSLFIEENLRDREVLAEATNDFLETQLADARRRLIEQEKPRAYCCSTPDSCRRSSSRICKASRTCRCRRKAWSTRRTATVTVASSSNAWSSSPTRGRVRHRPYSTRPMQATTGRQPSSSTR